ncbi:hypothetical protein FQN49_003727 [Arthroderma sp. PD_2]|nr:hypothetical protein FQN49_003727 [Arthroderma sp. PD_2]
MADTPVTLRTRKFIRNPLLGRKQMSEESVRDDEEDSKRDGEGFRNHSGGMRIAHSKGVFARQQQLTGAPSMENSDILHPNRANISKDDLRTKLGELYKASKDQISVFGLRTHYGGGKTTGFALVYDSTEALKKFEPRYRLIRYGAAEKIERPSRKQRKSSKIRANKLRGTAKVKGVKKAKK